MKQELIQQEQQRALHIFDKEKLSIINATPEELNRIAELNPKLFDTKYTRWGCQFKCIKCNGYRVLTGGVRSLLQISRFVNDQKYGHRKYCKHPRWEESWSLHATEIQHTYVEVTTVQTTQSITFVDISGASIAASNFTGTRKYLLLNTIMQQTDPGVSGNFGFGFSSVHGTTKFVESEGNNEQFLLTGRPKFAWFTVFTQPSTAELIKMQHLINDVANTCSTKIVTLFSMEISEDLNEGTDWDFNHVTPARSVTDTFVADASITIQTADHAVGDTYMVMSYSNFGGTLSGVSSAESRLARSGEATSTEPTVILESNSIFTDKSLQFQVRTFDLGASDNTFESEARHTSSGSHVLEEASVFALNMEKFVNSNEIQTEGAITLTSTDWSTLLATLSMTPNSTGDIFILGYWLADFNSFSITIQGRMQVDNSDEPPSQSTYTVNSHARDARDQDNQVANTVLNLDATSHTVDLDGDSNVGGTEGRGRQIIMLSMELLAEITKVVDETENVTEGIVAARGLVRVPPENPEVIS